MNSTHKLAMAASFCTMMIIPAIASATLSIGSYSKCKSEFKGKQSSIDSCVKCVEGGNFYQKNAKTKKWTCGMAEGMTKSKAAAVEKGPTKPSKMPDTAKAYVTIPAGTFKIGPPKAKRAAALTSPRPPSRSPAPS